VKLLPRPSELSTETVPPWSFTNSNTSAEADARAFVRAAPGLFHAMKTFEEPRHLFLRNAGSGVGNGQLDSSFALGKPDGYGAFERVFERVGKKIEHHLFPHLVIDMHGLR
jgi:hypothetical protein